MKMGNHLDRCPSSFPLPYGERIKVRGSKVQKAIVLFSGGLDSATTLYYAKSKGYDCECLIFDYGQRHKREIESAKKIARACGAGYKVIKIKLPWKGSALLDNSISVPKPANRPTGEPVNIPSTYVPARNTIFLSFAASFAEAIGARAVFIGANAIDYSGYPDCRPAYFEAFGKAIGLGTKAGIGEKPIEIFAPLIDKTKAGIIRMGMKLKAPYELTWSCYKGGKSPCLECDSCALRAKGFKEAGLADPAIKQ